MGTLQQDNFEENRLRQILLDAEANPVATGWDTPSVAVWEGVVETLEQKRRRRFLLWWLWGAVVAAALLVTLKDMALKQELTLPEQTPKILEPQGPRADAETPRTQQQQTAPPAPAMPQTEHPLQPKSQQNPTFAKKDVYEASQQRPKDTTIPPKSTLTTTLTGAGTTLETTPAAQLAELQTVALFLPFEPIAVPNAKQLAIPERTAGVPVPVETPKRAIQWWAGFHGGPVYAGSSVRARQPGALLFRNQEMSQWSSERGLDVKMISASGWYAYSGVSRYSIRQQTSQVFRLRFEGAREQQLPSGEWESTFALSVPSSFGESEAELDMRRDDSTPLQEGQAIVVEVKSTHALQYLSYRAGGGFLKSSGRWMYGAGAGIAFNTLQSREFNLTARSRQSGIRLPIARIRQAFNEASHHAMDLEISGWMGYRISPRWMLGAEPRLRRSLSPMVRHSQFSTAATSAGLQLSVHYLL